MGPRGSIVGALIAALLLTIVAAGCGSEASSDANANQIEAIEPGEPEAAKAFVSKGGENEIPKFGKEASAEEREAAYEVLDENLKARAAGDWAKQCATLSPLAKKEVSEGAAAQGVSGGGCAKELAGRAKPLKQTKSLRAYSLTGPIDALRFQGTKAWALYHGKRGVDYAMKMEKIDGEWGVGSLLETEI